MFCFRKLLIFLLLIPSVKATTFSYSFFELSPRNISLEGNASSTDGFIQLTTNRRDALLNNSVGRAVYTEPVRLYDSTTGKLADFTTRFTFVIKMLFPPDGADGLAFFIAPNGSHIPYNSGGNCLGIISDSSKFNSTKNPVVAVEFDTFPNAWDPRLDHVGIDVNSIASVATWNTSTLKNGSEAIAWVRYNSSTQNLSVYLTFALNPVFSEKYFILSYVLDLREVLPEWVTVGLSAATGSSFEVHNILSWEFNSTDFPSGSIIDGGKGKSKKTLGLVIGLVLGGSFLVGGFGLILLFWWKKANKKDKENEDFMLDDVLSDNEYEKGTGPKRFTYAELVRSTNDFSEVGKLGEGGFGGVYRGILSDSNWDVAVKRVSQGSKQGKKEFVSEVKIISRLRHRNLVQLLGWCNERQEFLLVYEFMPNGSLDTHLFNGKTMLTWELRYKIAVGLASALLYLHEEWEQCVVHRDIKSSNLMLDSNFNAKLGDFGLARLVDHDLGAKTTMLAGTMGYLAPECVTSGRAGKESDVYSFGVVALEIACGRRAVEPHEERRKVGLVSWVWELYGSRTILEAGDPKLSMDFDEKQMEQLMIVGLWCANFDPNLRPSIRQAISVLNFESPLPNLPMKMSLPTHFTTPSHVGAFSNASSSSNTDSQINQSQCSCSSCSTSSSNFNSSLKYSTSSALLHSAPR
ncbi:hypothetical protein GIB67_005611 [Kingdonia uniflora]|uniref:non-specific serine/threonine protein kinase n=1 Tax=Kingdonia uniflora TaxID=39325 RepID=A0A7J7NHR9_9MAGN|nr:hypothetical protein GIB67_005611 [Kingdonia uniflora]